MGWFDWTGFPCGPHPIWEIGCWCLHQLYLMIVFCIPVVIVPANASALVKSPKTCRDGVKLLWFCSYLVWCVIFHPETSILLLFLDYVHELCTVRNFRDNYHATPKDRLTKDGKNYSEIADLLDEKSGLVKVSCQYLNFSKYIWMDQDIYCCPIFDLPGGHLNIESALIKYI